MSLLPATSNPHLSHHHLPPPLPRLAPSLSTAFVCKTGSLCSCPETPYAMQAPDLPPQSLQITAIWMTGMPRWDHPSPLRLPAAATGKN